VDDEERLTAVGATAVTVALCRAQESRRPHPWFVDPIAEHVAEIAEPARDVTPRPGLVFWIAVRTRFLDELVTDAVRRGIDQVAILGAGLDARAFRLDWPANVTIFEVDRAPVLALKQRLVTELGLEPRCERRAVVADVTEPVFTQLLAEQGWRSERPTCWISEGLLVYLEPAARDSLLGRLAALSGAGSRLGATATTAKRAAQVALFRSGIDGDPAQWLDHLGWHAGIDELPETAAKFGRPLPAKAATSASAILIDARRRAGE